MSTNILISVPSRPCRCIQIDRISLEKFVENLKSSFFHHVCDLEDSCRASFPCLRSDFFIQLVHNLYNFNYDLFYLLINNKIIKYDNKTAKYATDGRDYGKEIVEFKDQIGVSVLFRILGGKGGFGKILKTQASKKRQSNNLDSCRNLQGQRIRTVRLSEQMNKYKEKESEREKVEKDSHKLPKSEISHKSDESEKIPDEKFEEKVKKEVSKVKETVLRGFDKRMENESNEVKNTGDLESKRLKVLDACLNVYDL